MNQLRKRTSGRNICDDGGGDRSQEAQAGEMKQGKETSQRKGFSYSVRREQITEYRKWPHERKLSWLLMANKMRKFLPSKTIGIQEAFREGKI